MTASPAAEQSQRVRDLNETFRQCLSGGRVVMSAGFAALPSVARAALLAAVRGFDHFEAENDPHGQRDFGTLTLAGYRCFWKIDCHNLGLRCASPDQTDAAGTIRVLTLMLAEEY